MELQAKVTRSLKLRLRTQLLQYQKIWECGILEAIVILIGKWSEVVLPR
jgi:hypothetical protein